MITPPLLMLYNEWLRQGPSFPMMAHVCRYYAYTYKLDEVHFYAIVDDDIKEEFSHPTSQSDKDNIQLPTHRSMPSNNWYTLSSGLGNSYYLGIREDDKLIGLYHVKTETFETSLTTSPILEWHIAAIQWLHQLRWLANADWKFTIESTERWMVVKPTGVIWHNPSLTPWFLNSDTPNTWPQWVHSDAIVRNNIFWEQMHSKKSWTGMVSGNSENPSTWWYIQKMEGDNFLVRVNTYEELTTNLLAQSHWQRHDPLTALPREGQMQWNWSGTDDQVWSIALISMDTFYSLNTKYGPDYVDKGLLEIAAFLRSRLPAEWTLWRGRAEQFYAMGPYVEHEWLVGVLRIALTESALPEVTTSIGIGTDISYMRARKLAHEANQQATAKGGNQLILNSYNKRIRSDASLKESMLDIKVQQDITLVYDPLYKNSVIGFRLHPNWVHPIWGVIKGDEFLPHCEPELVQEYTHWVVQQLMHKSGEWRTLGMDHTNVIWPFPGATWMDPKVHSILTQEWNAEPTESVHRIFEINEVDALQNFDTLKLYHADWKAKKMSLCIALKNNSDPNVLKLLQLQPEYVSLPWPFARSAAVHKAINELVSFLINRQIKIIAYCPHGVGAPQLFAGSIQQKPYH